MTAASLPRSSATPADLSITPRDRRFGRDEATPRWWHGGNPYASALYNALSATFPEGEAFFVDSVRKHRDGVDAQLALEIPQLKAAIKAIGDPTTTLPIPAPRAKSPRGSTRANSAL